MTSYTRSGCGSTYKTAGFSFHFLLSVFCVSHSTMLSPAKPLSPQRMSLTNSRSYSQKSTPSPTKSSPSKYSPSKLSPTKYSPSPFQGTPNRIPRLGFKLATNSSNSPLKSAFSIYEDTPEEHSKFHSSVSPDIEQAHDDKENVLQPKRMALQQASLPSRRPLANLPLADFPGYVNAMGLLQMGPVQLKQLYQPPNYSNESGSVHKFNHMPSYITPPRNMLRKILHASTEQEDDDVEIRLLAKQKEYMKRKRSMSVGINKGKAHLVAKNKFKILSA